MRDQITNTLERLDKKLTEEYFSDKPVSISFAGGHAGVAMFYGYYYLFTKDPEHLQKCEGLVEKLVEKISEDEDHALTLCDGVAGAAFCINHLIEKKIIDADPDILDDIDDFLGESAVKNIDQGNPDLLHGGVGMALYLFHRGRRNFDALNSIVQALNASSSKSDDGQFWLDGLTKTAYDRGGAMVNTGLAHGMPATIGLLARLVKKEIGGSLAVDMLRDSTSFLIKSVGVDHKKSFFPNFVPAFQKLDETTIDPNDYQSRLAWCYGDLGLSLPLMEAGEVLKDEALRSLALRAAENTTAKISGRDTGVVDGGICHGYAGAAHIYNRLFLKTRLPVFRQSTRYWTRALYQFIEAHGGIESFKDYDGEIKDYKVSHNFLKGSTGAGLALISIAESSIEPDWDQWLLLS